MRSDVIDKTVESVGPANVDQAQASIQSFRTEVPSH